MALKRTRIIMLPTDEKSLLGLNSIHNYLFFAQDDMAEMSTQKYQHLYLISEDKPKAGDYVIFSVSDTRPKTVAKVVKIIDDSILELSFNDNKNLEVFTKSCKKIIASTDDSLVVSKSTPSKNWKTGSWKKQYLPQPTQDFIAYYVTQYNIGDAIEWVDVEYEVDCQTDI